LLTPQGLSELAHSAAVVKQFPRLCKIPLLLDPKIYYGLAGLTYDPELSPFIRRFIADPKGWAIDAAEETIQVVQFCQSMGEFLSSEGMEQVMVYSCIRSNLQRLQWEKEISCILGERTISLMGNTLNVVNVEDQLDPLLTDQVAIADSARKTVQFFMQFIVRYEARYRLLENVGGDEEEQVEIQDLTQWFNATYFDALQASLYSECRDWVPCEDGGYLAVPCDRDALLDPDEVRLHVRLWQGSTTRNVTFVAEHRDHTRFPWKNNPAS
jgi:hypothetical protein